MGAVVRIIGPVGLDTGMNRRTDSFICPDKSAGILGGGLKKPHIVGKEAVNLRVVASDITVVEKVFKSGGGHVELL